MKFEDAEHHELIKGPTNRRDGCCGHAFWIHKDDTDNTRCRVIITFNRNMIDLKYEDYWAHNDWEIGFEI